MHRRNNGTERNVLSWPPRQSTARTKLRWSSLVHLSLGTVDLLYRLVVVAEVLLPPPPLPPPILLLRVLRRQLALGGLRLPWPPRSLSTAEARCGRARAGSFAHCSGFLSPPGRASPRGGLAWWSIYRWASGHVYPLVDCVL